MKKTLLALAALAALAIPQIQAGTVTPVTPGSFTYGVGDVFLGFTSSSQNKDYVVDLGDYSTYFNTAFNGGNTLNIQSDLVSVFGAYSGGVYGTATDLKWSVFGINYDINTGNPLSAVGSVLAGAPALAKNNTSALGNADTPLSAIISQLNGFDTALTQGVQQTVGVNSDTKGVNMWLGVADSASPFSLYNQVISGVVSTNLDIYNSTATTATKIYTLNFNAGVVSSVAAVPEPSTYALLSLGVFLIIFACRRKVNS